ncbi:MAG: hypothetical protein MK108_06120 [Mariniblastus sp.]|nr:hypothetical protein [Mariniblastus sp.]
MTTEKANHDHQDDDAHGAGKPEKPGYDDLNTPVILLVGVISTIVTFLTIAFVQGLCYKWQGSFIRERITDYPNTPINEQIDSQKKMLTGDLPGTISIEDSMKKVIAEYGQKSAGSSN